MKKIRLILYVPETFSSLMYMQVHAHTHTSLERTSTHVYLKIMHEKVQMSCRRYFLCCIFINVGMHLCIYMSLAIIFKNTLITTIFSHRHHVNEHRLD